MPEPLIQLPNGDWVKSSDVRKVAVEPYVAGEFAVVVRATDETYAARYETRAEAEVTRDLLASAVNAALADRQPIAIRYAAARVKEGFKNGWDAGQMTGGGPTLDENLGVEESP